ncbi:MAG TPA: DUF6687 family protein [Acidimicrobiales bacterium]|nr:DUF6687 family protein [Acidimicrobiales bacterium]
MTDSRFPSYRYLGLDELGDQRHLVVDGAPRPNTTTVLSHWPISPTPTGLWRDLSAEIVYAYLLDPDAWDRSVEVVTNDHLDVDGLISLYFLINPDRAVEKAELLIEVARVGDFGVVRSTQAAEIAWILEALMQDPDLAIVDLVDSAVTPGRATTVMYRALLALLERIIESPERYESIVRGPRERFQATMVDLAAGRVALEEHLESDLCIAHVDRTVSIDEGSNIVEGVPIGVDRYAIHSATSASRILVCHGQRFVYYDRYETWVRYVSQRHLLRRDLQKLALQLNAIDNVQWVAGHPSTLAPVLHHGENASSLTQDCLVKTLLDFLSQSPVAWNPFESHGGAFATS